MVTTDPHMSELTNPELPALGIVAALDDDDRRLLSDYGEFLPVQPGADLIKEGQEQNSLFFVISGVLHAHSEKDGRRALLGRIASGETIGEMAVFAPAPASANVTAQEFAQVWKATRADLMGFLEAYPEAGGRLLLEIAAELSRRMRGLVEKLSTAELEVAIQNYFQ